MHEAEALTAITGRAATEQVDGARRHLSMLRSLLDEMQGTTHALVPGGPGSWRSAAADGYAEGLSYLRERLAGALAAIADAESALEYCIARMERRLEASRLDGGRS
ncbi:hypothetical protein EV187_3434 [Agromyces ramosus]|uniref:WXG100 family type VII secretion target n=1 Tax=Agromyces ramosus TaxID=33879 RepID=A0A4Q7M9U4_9MICO|nr:hypothetical protein [Agromyces ramosus]RZS63528.1 hypothetical protein EV187_3434 [Agromyces ramosus]